jgi:dihydroneopterin aldolase
VSQDRITLKGLRFHTRVGLLPHEAQHPQPLELDVTAWLSLKPVGESDSPRGLVDYRDLYAIVADVIGTSHHRLLEALCEKVAARVLEVESVQRVQVAARKPHAPIAGPLDWVEVAVDRHAGK